MVPRAKWRRVHSVAMRVRVISPLSRLMKTTEKLWIFQYDFSREWSVILGNIYYLLSIRISQGTAVDKFPSERCCLSKSFVSHL